MLGLKLIFLDAGSGAGVSVSEEMVRQVKKEIDVPLVVGGGIRDGNTARRICEAGADVIVVGNAIEEDPQRIIEISAAVQIGRASCREREGRRMDEVAVK